MSTQEESIRTAAEQIAHAFGLRDVDAVERRIRATVDSMNASTERVLRASQAGFRECPAKPRPTCQTCGHPEGYCGQC